MKKVLVWLLVITLCLSLCACGKKQQNDTLATEPTDGTQESTVESTQGTTPTEDDSASATEPSKAPDTETTQPTTPPATQPATQPTTPAACSHAWQNATCKAPKTCTKCGATEGSKAAHTWKAATCSAPKTCTICGATEGAAIAHTFTDGTCTACGAAHGVKTFENKKWRAEILFPETDEYGENLEVAMLIPADGKTWTYRDFFEKNPHGEQVMDEMAYNGKTYYNYSFSAAMGGFEYEALANGNVKVDFVWGNGTVLELRKDSDTQFTVVSSTNANYIPVGTVYTSK